MLYVTGISLQMRKVIKLKSIHQCIYFSASQLLRCESQYSSIQFQNEISLFFHKNCELQVCNRIFEITVVLVKAQTFLSDCCLFIPEGINLSLKLKTVKLATYTLSTKAREYYETLSKLSTYTLVLALHSVTFQKKYWEDAI